MFFFFYHSNVYIHIYLYTRHSVCIHPINLKGHTKQLKGFGYVDFKKEESAVIAVKKNGKLSLKKRPLIIDFETSEQKSSFKRNEWLHKTNSNPNAGNEDSKAKDQ